MKYTLLTMLINIFCSWFHCGMTGNPSHTIGVDRRTNSRSSMRFPNFGRSLNLDRSDDPPLVKTTSGIVQGFKMKISEGREIYAFKGVPYGEPPIGNLRFSSPLPRRPWKGVWKATSPSPFCFQPGVMETVTGQEDCLFLNIYTPRIPNNNSIWKNQSLPVIIWLFGGANYFGTTRLYGPNYFLREDVVLVVINVRLGVFGFLSTGDEVCPGNWNLKDQSLAVQFIHDNARAFGGDPNKITIGGISSGAYSSQAMLFTNHKTKNYIKGIIALSGTMLTNIGLDTTGRVQMGSDSIAKAVGCPSSAGGNSVKMLECLRQVEPHVLAVSQFSMFRRTPFYDYFLGPTLEPNVTGAFISELPEKLYERGEVPPIPIILTRTEDETSVLFSTLRYQLFLPISLNWNEWMSRLLKWGYRSYYGVPAQSKEEKIQSMARITQLYYNRTTPPQITKKKDFLICTKLLDDNFVHAAMWKSIEHHHKIAPTYAYIMKHHTFGVMSPALQIVRSLLYKEFKSSHASEFVFLFNNVLFPSHKPGSDFDIISRNMINIFVNFANFGEPLYRTPDHRLLSLWQPVKDLRRPYVLEVGLRHNISMIRDPLVGTERLKIWETVRF